MPKTDRKKKSPGAPGSAISARIFVSALLVIAALMVVSYLLTFTTEKGLPFWKWILSPVLVLGAEGGGTIIAIAVFLLVIGGIFSALEICGLMEYMIDSIARRFGRSRYTLMAVMTFFFMAMGSLIGSFEEVVPMVPLVAALAVRLGWDVMTGLGMSLLAAGCGFAAGVCNPFSVGVAQSLAGLPMFSGAWLRALSFVCIYGLLFLFLLLHGKKVEKSHENVPVNNSHPKNPAFEKGVKSFAGIMGAGILIVLCSGFLTFLQDYTMIIVAVMFLAAGIVSCMVAGMDKKTFGKCFLKGVINMLPAVVMILMASSIRYILSEAEVLDLLLGKAVALAGSMPRWTIILFIYLIVLILNFFIPSGSAKAFIVIPLIVPLAREFGISAQLCIVAFAFGDGFSNVYYPTNPALLISLGLINEKYSRWAKWSGRFQLLNLLLTGLILLLGLAVGY